MHLYTLIIHTVYKPKCMWHLCLYVCVCCLQVAVPVSSPEGSVINAPTPRWKKGLMGLLGLLGILGVVGIIPAGLLLLLVIIPVISLVSVESWTPMFHIPWQALRLVSTFDIMPCDGSTALH